MIFINNIDPVLFEYGAVSVRWYGLFFAIGIFLNYMILTNLFRKRGYPSTHLDSLVIYLFFGLVLGARIGHIVFYNWTYFSQNLLEVLKIWNGGLSSHGAAIGLFLAYLLWTTIHKVGFRKMLNEIVLPMPLTAAFVRLGNFFNSEIVGTPSGENFGVIFKKLGEDFPRHPAQLYEGVASLLIFVLMFLVYKKYSARLPKMFLLFLYLFLYFSARFVIEFWKDLHTLPADFPLSMGQVLSIVPIILSLVYFGLLIVKPKLDRA